MIGPLGWMIPSEFDWSAPLAGVNLKSEWIMKLTLRTFALVQASVNPQNSTAPMKLASFFAVAGGLVGMVAAQGRISLSGSFPKNGTITGLKTDYVSFSVDKSHVEVEGEISGLKPGKYRALILENSEEYKIFNPNRAADACSSPSPFGVLNYILEVNKTESQAIKYTWLNAVQALEVTSGFSLLGRTLALYPVDPKDCSLILKDKPVATAALGASSQSGFEGKSNGLDYSAAEAHVDFALAPGVFANGFKAKAHMKATGSGVKIMFTMSGLTPSK